MDLTSVKIIKEIFARYEARPSKRLGQNFLIDKNVLQKIIEAADLKPDDVVLEIGPGIGTLTQELAKTAGRVVAIEKDKKMCEIIKKTLFNNRCRFPTIVGNLHLSNNIKIINDDILKFDISKINTNFRTNISNDYAAAQTLPTFKYKLIANLPYYITSPVIRKFLESKYPPKEIVLMVQKEVAQRICSKPPDMNLLAVSVQFYAEAKIISYVSKNCFWPSPKVDSAIIKITPSSRRHPMSIQLDRLDRHRVSNQLFFKIVKAGFSQPRKQLGNNLSKMLKLTKEETTKWLLNNGIKPEQRAETLSIDDWLKLANNYKNDIV